MASIAELKAPPTVRVEAVAGNGRIPGRSHRRGRCPAMRLAADLASRMPRETGTQFKVWIDHLVLRGDRALAERLAELGYERQSSTYAVGVPLFAHSGGIFPPIALTKGAPSATEGAGLSRGGGGDQG